MFFHPYKIYVIIERIDFQVLVLKRFIDPMVNSNNQLKKRKNGTKARRSFKHLFILLLLGGGVYVESMAWGGGELEGKECWLGKARGWDG